MCEKIHPICLIIIFVIRKKLVKWKWCVTLNSWFGLKNHTWSSQKFISSTIKLLDQHFTKGVENVDIISHKVAGEVRLQEE